MGGGGRGSAPDRVTRRGVLVPPGAPRHTPGMHTALRLNHDCMGHGDPALGRKILAVFLRKLPSMQQVESILMVNSGVKLVAPDSPVLTELRELEAHGVDLMPCGTCVEAYGIQVAAGEVSNMDEIVAELGRADKVITL